MLVLQRKEGQTIVIGDDVVLHISRLHGSRVSIGIDAPRELTIRRGELDDWATKSLSVSEWDERTR